MVERLSTGQLVLIYSYIIVAILVFYIVLDTHRNLLRAIIAGIFWPVGLFLAVIVENSKNKR